MTDLRTAGFQRSPAVVGGVVGLIAAVPTGIVLQLGTGIVPILGGISGRESLVVGWIFHLGLDGAFGALFGWHLTWPIFRTLTKTTVGTVLWGILFGVVWYAFLMIGIVVPGTVELIGSSGQGARSFGVPGPAGTSLIAATVFALASLVYGAVLGAGYAVLEDVRAEPEPSGPSGERDGSKSQ